MVHQAGRFHLEADAILADVCYNLVACGSVLYKRISGCDNPVVHSGVRSVSRIALNLAGRVAAPTVRSRDVAARDFEEAVVFNALVDIARISLGSPPHL